MGKTKVFDIETDGLLLDVTQFWVGYTYTIEDDKYDAYYSAHELVAALNEADTIIGHNIIGYDIPVLNKLSHIGIRKDINIVDTLILAKLCYYNKDRSWSHSLAAYGERLGNYKGDHSDWTKYSPEMDKYCKQDVTVTTKLYKHLLRKTGWLPKGALDIEQQVQRIVTDQHQQGWLFDVKAARNLHWELVAELEEAEKELHNVFKPLDTFVPVSYPKVAYKKDGSKSQALLNHEARGCDIFVIDGKRQWGYYDKTVFNPGSNQHIVRWIEELYGKQKWVMTDKGNPKADAASLKKMFSDKDWAKPLLKYFEVKKLLGQLAEGDNAWLKKVRDDNRLHGSADILGAVTGRFTHRDPNMAQVPSSRAYKGKESRSLFTVPVGYKLVGCDASGLELRTLSHYLARFDGGAYGKALLEGDIHTANQMAAGLPTRDNAKTFIYGFLYGAGDAKIGQIVNGTNKEGATLRKKFLSKTTGLKKLVDAVKDSAKRGYLIGISGRRLYVRSPHSALNTLLQSAGAYVMKYYVVELERSLVDADIDFHFVGNIHDEIQMEVREDQAELAAKLAEDAFATVTDKLQFRCKLEGEAKVGNTWADTH